MNDELGSALLGWADPSPEPSEGLTLFSSAGYVPRDVAWQIHTGRVPAPSPPYFLLPLRRALARVAPGAFDEGSLDPHWRGCESSGNAVRLIPSADIDRTLVDEVVEIAEDCGCAVFDAGAGETSQPLRLDRVDQLSLALADVASDGYLVVDGGPDRELYVQAFGHGRGRLVLEAVSSHHLPSSLKLGSETIRRLVDMGFERPSEENANFTKIVSRRTAAERDRAATLMVQALVHAYGRAPGETFRLHTGSPS